MLDQYGDEIPDDLVVLMDLGLGFTETELNRVFNCRWYECQDYPNSILVSAEELGALADYMPALEDCGIDNQGKACYCVDLILHCYSDKDGFYHA